MILRLEDLHERHPGLTDKLAGALTEAARVCLSRHHSSPTTFDLERNNADHLAEVEWDDPSPVEQASNANELDATRDAAYSISFAAVELVEGLVVLSRAEAMSGADWYIGDSRSFGDLENAVRLEVSGLDRGNSRECRRRLGEKIAQLRKPGHPAPGIASVVGLREQLILIADS